MPEYFGFFFLHLELCLLDEYNEDSVRLKGNGTHKKSLSSYMPLNKASEHINMNQGPSGFPMDKAASDCFNIKVRSLRIVDLNHRATEMLLVTKENLELSQLM